MQIIVTLPKETPLKQFQKIRGSVKRKLDGPIKRTISKEFDKTVEGWTQKPNFEGKVTEPRGEIWLTVGPKGRGTLNWVRVHEGTGPRTIRAKTVGKPMVFPRHYRPRTFPGGSWGHTSLRYGPIVHTYVVRQHRIEPRKFSEIVFERLKGKIQQDVESAIRRSI